MSSAGPRTHADREQVIGILKAAFVQGMLAQDEFGGRVGQALAARTHADLDALTADLPPGLAAAQPPQPAGAPGEPRIPWPGTVLAAATAVCAAAWLGAFLLPVNGEGEPQAGFAPVTTISFVYVILLLTAGTPVLADWLNRHW